MCSYECVAGQKRLASAPQAEWKLEDTAKCRCRSGSASEALDPARKTTESEGPTELGIGRPARGASRVFNEPIEIGTKPVIIGLLFFGGHSRLKYSLV